jgi:hypothetical protein
MIDLHYVRAFFNPYLLGEAHLHHEEDVEKVLNKVLWKIVGNLIAYAKTLKDFIDFVESWSHFFNIPLVNDLNLLPHEWWDLIGVGGCTFTPITHYILVSVCSTSLCEWNWNSYSFVHNKVWNWLTSI